MPRNGSGTYELPLPDVTAGTSIQSSWANTTLGDIATALTNSIAKDGETVWTGVDDHNGNEIILDVDGDTSITADTDDQIDFKVGGADRVSMTSTNITVGVTVLPTGNHTISLGSTSLRFNGIWGNNMELTQSITAGGTVKAGTLTLGSGSITDSSGSLGVAVPINMGNTSATTGHVFAASGSALTTGPVAIFASLSSSASARSVLNILNQSGGAATGTALINLEQDSAAPIIRIASGTSSGSGVTTALTTRTTPGSIAGFMQITVAGNKRWIAFYNDPS